MVLRTMSLSNGRRASLSCAPAIALVLTASLAMLSGCSSDASKESLTTPAGSPPACNAAVVYCDAYEVDLPGMDLNPKLDARKCRHVAEALVRDGYVTAAELVTPDEATREQLLLVHTAAYLDSLTQPATLASIFDQSLVRLLSSGTVDRRILSAFRRATGGTIVAARRALETGLAINLGGGYHHAHPDRAMGSCLYADVPVAVSVLRREKRVRRVLVVDANVHQGNGLAVCFAGDPDVFTMSIHEADLWPPEKPPNDMDVGLKLPVDDATYLAAMSQHLPMIVREFKPELLIFIAGADVQAGDIHGHFSLTPEGILRRDEYVVNLARSAGVPLVYLIGGGYFPSAWRTQAASIGNLLVKFAGVQPPNRQTSAARASAEPHPAQPLR